MRIFGIGTAISLILVVALSAVGSAQAPPPSVVYQDVEFTVIITDTSDHYDFVDMREFAIGEPGDESIVVRITLNAWTRTETDLSVHLFYTAGGKGFRSGMNAGGKPASTNPWESCAREGTKAVAYCVMSYEALGVEIGDKITAPYGISYVGVAQDYAPGGHYEESVVTGAKGKDYTITGGKAPAEPAPAAPTLSLASDVTEVSGMPAESLNLTATLDNQGESSVNVTLSASEGAAVAFASGDVVEAEAGRSTTIDFSYTVPEDATPGSTLNFTLFAAVDGVEVANLTYTVSVAEPPAAAPEPGAGNETSSSANEEPESGAEESPGFGLPALFGSLGLLGLWFRRRRA